MPEPLSRRLSAPRVAPRSVSWASTALAWAPSRPAAAPLGLGPSFASRRRALGGNERPPFTSVLSSLLRHSISRNSAVSYVASRISEVSDPSAVVVRSIPRLHFWARACLVLSPGFWLTVGWVRRVPVGAPGSPPPGSPGLADETSKQCLKPSLRRLGLLAPSLASGYVPLHWPSILVHIDILWCFVDSALPRLPYWYSTWLAFWPAQRPAPLRATGPLGSGAPSFAI